MILADDPGLLELLVDLACHTLVDRTGAYRQGKSKKEQVIYFPYHGFELLSILFPNLLNYLMKFWTMGGYWINKWLCLLLICSICLPHRASAQGFSFHGKRKKDAIEFQIVKNLIIIPIFINKKGPYNFILDTGVSPLLVTDPTILTAADMKSARTIKLTGLGKGSEVEAFASNSLQVDVGRASMQNIPAAILKQDIFNLSNFLGVHIHGLIGYYFISSFLVKIKYSNQRMIFYAPGQKVKIKGEPIGITMILNKPYLQASIQVPVVGEIDARLLMDSGASNGLSLEAYKGKEFPQPKKKIPANLGMGFSGLISGNIGRVSQFKLGSFTLNNVIASYPNYEEGGAKSIETGRNGSVGADLLRHFDLTIDYANLKLYLKPNSNFKLPFEHDMSGLEVYIEEGKSNRFYVERIEPNSPGTKAGILEGDEIVSLNFTPVRTMDLEHVGNLFKSGDGRTVIVEVFRKKENMYKVLTLKKRI